MISPLPGRLAHLAIVALVAVAGCHAAASETPPAVEPGLSLAARPDRYVSRGAQQIRYRELGVGTPVVLLHGYTDRVEMWDGVADSLATRYRVIVPDIRGFGLSSAPLTAGSYGRAMSDDVVALLDSLRIGRVHIAGYSMGALIAADIAVRHPARIASAVLVAGPFYRDSTVFSRVAAPFVAGIERGDGLDDFFRFILPTWPDSAIAPVARQLSAAHRPEVLAHSLREMAALVPSDEALAGLSLPAVAVAGRNDPLFPLSRSLARRWKGLRVVELDDADHAVVFTAPEVLEAIRRLAR